MESVTLPLASLIVGSFALYIQWKAGLNRDEREELGQCRKDNKELRDELEQAKSQLQNVREENYGLYRRIAALSEKL